jgi:hypothetical protein
MLQCLKLMDHATLNFSNSMSMAVVFLDIDKAFNTTWHSACLLYKLYNLQFSPSLIKLISSFLSSRKFRVMVQGKMSMPRDIRAGVVQSSILSPTLYSLYINVTPQTPGVYLDPCASNTYIYTTDHKEGYVLRMTYTCPAWEFAADNHLLKF